MKIKLNLIVIFIACMIGSCSEEENPNAEAKFLKKLSGTWKISTIQLDGTDVTESFTGMELTFSKKKTYGVISGVAPIWNDTGTFSLLPQDDSYSIIRDDGVIMVVEKLTNDKLMLRFMYTSSFARAGSVSGEYVFDLGH